MKVLLTGGAGFIGSNLAEAYLQAGHDVTVVDSLAHGKRENVPPGAEFIKMDITDPALEGVFSAGGFDIGNHPAAQIDVRVSVQDPILDARINILGLLNLIENCRKYEVERFIFASSGGVLYGEVGESAAVETQLKLPLSPYGVSKYSGESYLFYYRMLFGIQCITLRYSNVYGPRQDPLGEAGVVAIFSRNYLKREPPTVFGDGEQQRDYVFVRDVACANLLASAAELPGDPQVPDDIAFNVGTGETTTVNDLVGHFNRITRTDYQANYAPHRPGELIRSCLDADKIGRFLGWTPEVTIGEGLEITYNWFRERWGN